MHRILFALAVLALLGAIAAPHGLALAAKTGPEQQVRLTVTGKGFVPSAVEVEAGRPVRMLITRKTDRTCATDIVLKQFGIKKRLPLNQPVEVRFTPRRPGTIRYACAMDMIAGEIVVR